MQSRDRTVKTCENHWRASLVPAAAVIPAPVAHIYVAAVKTFVVGHGDTVRKMQFSKQDLGWFSMGRREDRNR